MKSFRASVVLYVVAAAVLPLVVLFVFLYKAELRSSREGLDRSLLVEARTAAYLLAPVEDTRLQAAVSGLGRELGLRLTVLADDGRVLADTSTAPDLMENHRERSELKAALAGRVGVAERVSRTLGERMRYIAVSARGPAGGRVVRAAAPVAPVEGGLARIRSGLVSGVLLILTASGLLAARLGRQIVAPVETLAAAAARFSAGDPRAHVLPDGPEALRHLQRTFNEMVDRLNHQLQALDETQAYLDAILRQMPDGLLVLDSRGIITRANLAAAELLGSPVERMVGRPVLAIALDYALDREVTQALEERVPATVDLRTPDGRSLRIAIGPLFVRDQPAGAVALLQDLSELRRADAMRRDFVANVSHEIRTPVAAIRALLETLILRAAKRPELLDEYGPRLVTECERIDRMVSDLLLLAQTESGKLQLELEALDAREVAEDVVRQVEPVALSEGSELVLEEFQGRELVADRTALSQCLRNLVDNAVHHAGGVIRIGSRQQGGQVVLHVADSGPGIPAEDLPRVFERFYRVDKARTRAGGDSRGSGLGLSIVRHLTEAQGGRAWVESRPGAGSTFFLAFNSVTVATDRRT